VTIPWLVLGIKKNNKVIMKNTPSVPQGELTFLLVRLTVIGTSCGSPVSSFLLINRTDRREVFVEATSSLTW